MPVCERECLQILFWCHTDDYKGGRNLSLSRYKKKREFFTFTLSSLFLFEFRLKLDFCCTSFGWSNIANVCEVPSISFPLKHIFLRTQNVPLAKDFSIERQALVQWDVEQAELHLNGWWSRKYFGGLWRTPRHGCLMTWRWHPADMTPHRRDSKLFELLVS